MFLNVLYRKSPKGTWTPVSRGGQASLAGETLNQKFICKKLSKQSHKVVVGNKRFRRAGIRTQRFLVKLTTKPFT